MGNEQYALRATKGNGKAKHLGLSTILGNLMKNHYNTKEAKQKIIINLGKTPNFGKCYDVDVLVNILPSEDFWWDPKFGMVTKLVQEPLSFQHTIPGDLSPGCCGNPRPHPTEHGKCRTTLQKRPWYKGGNEHAFHDLKRGELEGEYVRRFK